MVKKAILGGTFDPVHFGHLRLAESVIKNAGMDEIVFLPAGNPWQKESYNLATPDQRVSMVELAIKSYSFFTLSMVEMTRPGKTYTVDTLRELKADNPSEELYFIMGWDSLLKINTWKEPDEIIKLATIIAVPRPGYQKPDKNILEQLVKNLSERVILLDEPEIDISASEVRERIRQNLSISDLVPESVEQYIMEHNLYR